VITQPGNTTTDCAEPWHFAQSGDPRIPCERVDKEAMPIAISLMSLRYLYTPVCLRAADLSKA
jgi:hypothetical protein